MQRQMGCFIYDNLSYENLEVSDFESLISEQKEFRSVGETSPILTKYIIPRHLAREAFDYLDLHGVNGVHLLNEPAGAVADVYNSFNHNPRGNSWNLNS